MNMHHLCTHCILHTHMQEDDVDHWNHTHIHVMNYCNLYANNTSICIQPFFTQQSRYWLKPVLIHFFKMRIWCECTGAYGVFGCRRTLTCMVPLKLKELVGTHGPYDCVRTTHVPNAFHPQCMLLSFCPCHGLLAYKEERKKLERKCRRDEIRSLPH